MHVWRPIGDVTKRWGLERSPIGIIFRLLIPAEIDHVSMNVGANPQIVELIIGKQCVIFADGMTHLTIRFLRIHEQLESSLRRGRKRVFVMTVIEAVESRVAARS